MATVRYLVSDVARAVSFYVGQLGFERGTEMLPAFATVRREDLELWLAGPQSSAARPMPDGRRPGPGGWNRLGVEVDDLAAMVDALGTAGGAPRHHTPPGARGEEGGRGGPPGDPPA